MNIRRFKEEEAKEVSDLIRNTIRISNTKDYPLELMELLIETETPEHVLERASWTHFYVAEDEGRIVGLAVYRNILGDVDITNVQVRTGHRRQGIGRSIVEKTVSKARETGGRNYTLEVRASNTDAIRLYEALGFKTEGIRKGFYDHPKEDAIIMWLRDG